MVNHALSRTWVVMSAGVVRGREAWLCFGYEVELAWALKRGLVTLRRTPQSDIRRKVLCPFAYRPGLQQVACGDRDAIGHGR